MAFQNRNSNNNGNSDADWKADGFINFYLPTADGRAKVGAIALRKSRDKEAQLLEWLNADPANVQKLLKKLVIEFNPVNEAKPGFLLD